MKGRHVGAMVSAWSLLTCICAATGAKGAAAQVVDERPVDVLGRVSGVRVSQAPVTAMTRIYYARPSFPPSVALIAGPADDDGASTPDTLLGVGFFNGECTVRVQLGQAWEDTDTEEALVPAWNADVASAERILAFEPAHCPKAVFPRDVEPGQWDEVIDWAAAQIRPELEALHGRPLDLHPLQGGTWILPDGSRQTWIQLLFGPKGAPWWEGGDRVIVGIEYGPDRAPRLIFRDRPVEGYAAVPFALVDIDDDGKPEVFFDFGVAAEGLYEFQGVVVLGQAPDGSYVVRDIVAGWYVDMH